MSESRRFRQTTSLTDEIAEIIRNRILKGEYKIGEKIKESKIAEEMKVSRTPIREAFKQLEIEGLIDYIPNRGCFAKGFTIQDIEDIYAVRRSLELMAVERAVTEITPDELAELEEQLNLMESYADEKEMEKVVEASEAFLEILYYASRSRFLTQILHSYKEYLEKTKKKILMCEEKRLREILREYKEIFAGIKEGNLEETRTAMIRHLDASYQRASISYNYPI